MTDSKKKTTAAKSKSAAASAKKTTAVKKAVAAALPVTAQSELPTADALKERFKAGSIPLQTDFADLIDLANAGAQATGQAATQNGPGAGMRLSNTGQLEPDIGSYNFKNDKQGCSPVKVNTDTNQIVVDLDDGLAEGDSGLGVKAGNGITVDSDGVSIDPLTVLPKGIITMFSGSEIPTGWALCDGDNGTPDLRDRFIKGSTSLSSSKGGSDTVSFTPEGTVTVGEHQLTIDEMPEHAHSINFDPGGIGNVGISSRVFYGIDRYESSIYVNSLQSGNTFPVGENKSHNHPGDFTGKVQEISIEPLYYALAFIMKL